MLTRSASKSLKVEYVVVLVVVLVAIEYVVVLVVVMLARDTFDASTPPQSESHWSTKKSPLINHWSFAAGPMEVDVVVIIMLKSAMAAQWFKAPGGTR